MVLGQDGFDVVEAQGAGVGEDVLVGEEALGELLKLLDGQGLELFVGEPSKE